MAVLKSRNKFPPYGFQLLLPETGMREPITGSFSAVVDAFAKIVQKNPALAEKNGWPKDRVSQENWLDAREAQRMVAHGWFGFVDMDGVSPPLPAYAGGVSRQRLGASVAAAGSTALTGLAIYREIFSGRSTPVDQAEAERRAAICVVCPVHKKGNLKDWFIATVAKGLTELYGVMHDLDMRTSRDGELGKCDACHCPMRAKVWVELATALKHLKPEERAKLHEKCWMIEKPAGS